MSREAEVITTEQYKNILSENVQNKAKKIKKKIGQNEVKENEFNGEALPKPQSLPSRKSSRINRKTKMGFTFNVCQKCHILNNHLTQFVFYSCCYAESHEF